MLSKIPTAGDSIVGTGGARKILVAGRGKGKSGGYHVIAFYGGDNIPVFLLAVFSKGHKVNLTKAERNELRTGLAELADNYREGLKKWRSLANADVTNEPKSIGWRIRK